MLLNCGGKTLDLSQPQIMGVLNITPDSFSDGGQWQALDAAVAQAKKMVAEGAAIIDIGGESTRPGAAAVSVVEEIERVVPLIELLAPELDVPLSIDTSKPHVMRCAIGAGANMINDVNALQAEGALRTAAALDVPICIMHMQGSPRTMQNNPHYQDVVADVFSFLEQRCQAALAQGVKPENLLIDPGFGFGKTLAHNYQLLARLEVFKALPYPLLVGMSRKSMLGQLLDKPPLERVYAGVAAATLAVQRGATIIRTHDVAATADALKVCAALKEQERAL